MEKIKSGAIQVGIGAGITLAVVIILGLSSTSGIAVAWYGGIIVGGIFFIKGIANLIRGGIEKAKNRDTIDEDYIVNTVEANNSDSSKEENHLDQFFDKKFNIQNYDNINSKQELQNESETSNFRKKSFDTARYCKKCSTHFSLEYDFCPTCGKKVVIGSKKSAVIKGVVAVSAIFIVIGAMLYGSSLMGDVISLDYFDDAASFESNNNDNAFIPETLPYEERKPITAIEDQNINWDFYDSKGNQYSWFMPVESYEYYIQANPNLDTFLFELESGETVEVIDHTKFVKTSFTEVIDDVYDNTSSDKEFIYEVWYITSQLTTYSYDIGEYPRYALETLSRGGGDCEDTAILIADMIRSSKHTTNWDVELVYFDANNPTLAQEVNHVAVAIDTGEYFTVVESTAKDNDTANAWNGAELSGWWYDV